VFVKIYVGIMTKITTIMYLALEYKYSFMNKVIKKLYS